MASIQSYQITDELESRSHELMLEQNTGVNYKCRANQCLVMEYFLDQTDRIQSQYMLRLINTISRTYRYEQCFHVSCLESIGVDIAQHVSIHSNTVSGSVQDQHWEPAISSWVTQKGGQPKRPLSSVLLQILRADHLEPMPMLMRLSLVEYDKGLSYLSVMALVAAAEAEMAQSLGLNPIDIKGSEFLGLRNLQPRVDTPGGGKGKGNVDVGPREDRETIILPLPIQNDWRPENELAENSGNATAAGDSRTQDNPPPGNWMPWELCLDWTRWLARSQGR